MQPLLEPPSIIRSSLRVAVLQLGLQRRRPVLNDGPQVCAEKPLLDESQVFAAVKEARRWIKTHKTEAGVPWKSLAEPFAAGGITARILSFRTLAAINGVKVQDRPGKEPVLGRRLDTALAEWVRAMASRGLPPTILQVKTKAARIARSMKVSFKRVLPGEEYFRGFVKRHALSLRKPTGLAELIRCG